MRRLLRLTPTVSTSGPMLFRNWPTALSGRISRPVSLAGVARGASARARRRPSVATKRALSASISTRQRPAEEFLRHSDGFGKGLSECQLRGDRGGEGAAGAVGGFGLDPRGGEPVFDAVLEEQVGAFVLIEVSALEQDRDAELVGEAAGGGRHFVA